MHEPREKQPLDYRPPSTADRYERNGWIGLIITLVGCLVAAYLYIVVWR